MLSTFLPNARYLLGDKAYDADHWRSYLKSRRIQPVIPNKSNRKNRDPFNKIEQPDVWKFGTPLISHPLLSK